MIRLCYDDALSSAKVGCRPRELRGYGACMLIGGQRARTAAEQRTVRSLILRAAVVDS